MIFIIKYCLLLDTSELFVGSKMELKKYCYKKQEKAIVIRDLI